MSVEAQIESAEVGYWFHLSDPLSNQSVYEVLAAGVLAAKAEYREALYRHDRPRADALVLEIADLTAVTAAAADGLACQRQRFLAGDRPWPLAPVC